MYINNLFVFGTLLPGLKNYQRFIEPYHPKVFKAKAQGTMYYITADDYPVVVDGPGEIKGVLYQFQNLSVVLPELDEIEKFTGVVSHSLLIREVREVENLETGEKVKAYLFLWPPERREALDESGIVIEDGDWARFLKEKIK